MWRSRFRSGTKRLRLPKFSLSCWDTFASSARLRVFFVYDPQTGVAFDPLDLKELNREIYDEVIPKIKAAAKRPPKS